MNKSFIAGCLLASLIAAPVHAETLEDAMVKAYQSNPALEGQRAQLRAIDEQVSQAESGWRPSVNAVTSVGKLYTKTPDNSFLPPIGSHTPQSVGIEVAQPIFHGGRTVNGIDAADKKVLAGRAQLQAAEEQLLLNVGKAYLDILRDQTVIDLYHHNHEVLDLRATETNKRFSIGEVTRTDVLQSQARLQGTKTNLTQALGQLESDKAAYLRYVGKMPENLQEPKLDLQEPKTLEDTVDVATGKNPAVIAARYAEEASNANTDVAKGALLPQIDLVGNVGRSWQQNDFIPGRQDSAQVLLRMTIPLYNAGTDYSKVRESQQTASARRMELEDVRLGARQMAISSWTTLLTAKSAIASSQSQVEANEMALEGVKKENAAGTRTTLDILNAEQELLAAKVNLVQSKHDEAVAILQVKAAICVLTADALKLPVERYRPEDNYEDVSGKWIGFAKTKD